MEDHDKEYEPTLLLSTQEEIAQDQDLTNVDTCGEEKTEVAQSEQIVSYSPEVMPYTFTQDAEIHDDRDTVSVTSAKDMAGLFSSLPQDDEVTIADTIRS